MTKEQFESGVSFKVKGRTYKGAETFRYEEFIMRETRSSIDERVMYYNHHVNVSKIGRTCFIGFTFIMNKKVNVKYKFEDLVVFED